MRRVVIIGGGISGLAAAYYLKRYASEKAIPIEIRVLERERRLGGTIKTVYEDGFTVEGGPDCFLSEKPWALTMAREMGVEWQIVGTNEENKGTYIYSDEKLYRLPEGVMLMVPTRILPMLTTGLLTLHGKIRMGMDLFIKPRKDDVEESLAEFVTRRLGREALEKIAEPLVAGVHAGAPESMSLRATFPRFKQLEDDHGSLIKGMLARMRQTHKKNSGDNNPLTMFVTFHDGLGEFIGHLRSTFKDEELLIGHSVTTIMKKTAGGWLINIVNAPMMEADAIISAVPAYQTSAFLHNVDTELAEELRQIPYVSTATVSLAFESHILPKLKGFGFVVPRDQNRKIMAATWTSRKFFNRSPEGTTLLRCFFGSAHQPGMFNQDDETFIRTALAELRHIAGLNAEPLKAWVFRWPFSMPQTIIGHEARMQRIRERLALLPGIEICGGAYYGLGIPDCVYQGQLAAERLANWLAQQAG